MWVARENVSALDELSIFIVFFDKNALFLYVLDNFQVSRILYLLVLFSLTPLNVSSMKNGHFQLWGTIMCNH